MRGKKPSEREKYVLRADSGTFVEVTREVYLEWHRAGRRERYQMEKKRAHGVCSLETLGENIRPAMKAWPACRNRTHGCSRYSFLRK